jgi:hypothetical protein
MSKNFLRITGLSLLALYTATTGFADSKVRARYSSGGQSNESTILTKGTRQRLEYGTGMSAVTQCDLKRIVQIIDKTKSYLVMPLDGNLACLRPSHQRQPPRSRRPSMEWLLTIRPLLILANSSNCSAISPST